jgi:hypothetical protein
MIWPVLLVIVAHLAANIAIVPLTPTEKAKPGDVITFTASARVGGIEIDSISTNLYVYNPSLPVCCVTSGDVVCPGLRVVWLDSSHQRHRGVWLRDGRVGEGQQIIANPFPMHPVIPPGWVSKGIAWRAPLALSSSTDVMPIMKPGVNDNIQTSVQVLGVGK